MQTDGERDLVFVPVGLNDDRTLEDRTLLLGDSDAPRPGRCRPSRPRCASSRSKLSLMLRSRWYRFGYACVNFGTPVSVRAYAAERGIDFRRLPKDDRSRAVAELGHRLVDDVRRSIPVLPVPLVATVVLRAARPLSEFELKSAVADRAHASSEPPARKSMFPAATGITP